MLPSRAVHGAGDDADLVSLWWVTSCTMELMVSSVILATSKA